MLRRRLALAILALTLASLSGEQGCTTKVHPVAPRLTGSSATPDSIQAIFSANCTSVGCHAQPNPEAGMDLSAGASYGAIVGVASLACTGLQRVKPFDPDNSCLVKRITGAVTPQMPKFAAPLPDTTITRITRWIQQGAPAQVTPTL